MRLLLGIASAAVLFAAGTDPKPTAEEYPAHARVGGAAIGADYLVRSVPGPRESYFSGDYLVVEVAFYPPKSQRMTVRGGDFRLRVNGSKRELLPQTPGMVAAAVKYPDWEPRPQIVAGGSVGSGTVVYGPRRTGRFPGDPNDPTLGGPRRLPPPPDSSGQPRQERDSMQEAAEAIVELALPEGDNDMVVSGLLYYAWKDKASKIRKLELVYDGPAGKAVLELK